MDLKEILSVAGKPGLYKTIANTKTGMIVESLIDNKRIPVYASDKISNLEDIYIFTTETEKPLKEVFKIIYDREKGEKCISHKEDDRKLKEYFGQVLPDYDKERVYTSDIKKVFAWYNLLIENKLLDFTEKTEEPAPVEAKEEKTDEPAETKKAKTEKKTGRQKKSDANGNEEK